MRRRSLGVKYRDELLSARIVRLEAEDPQGVIDRLEPFVNERRRERLLTVIGRRLGSVRVGFESPHDPHNGAAVIRSCEAFGVQRLHVMEQKERFLSAASVSKSAEKWIDVHTHGTIEEGVAALRGAACELVAAHPDGTLVPTDLAGIPRLALILGNERDGLSPELMSACARSVRVPMRGFVESLNVSVTAAILLSAATADRSGDLSPADRKRLYARGLYLSVPHADDHLGFPPSPVESG